MTQAEPVASTSAPTPAVDDVLVSIVYGSETGTAQDTAEQLARELRRRHFRARTMAMDDYPRVRRPRSAPI